MNRKTLKEAARSRMMRAQIKQSLPQPEGRTYATVFIQVCGRMVKYGFALALSWILLQSVVYAQDYSPIPMWQTRVTATFSPNTEATAVMWIWADPLQGETQITVSTAYTATEATLIPNGIETLRYNAGERIVLVQNFTLKPGEVYSSTVSVLPASNSPGYQEIGVWQVTSCHQGDCYHAFGQYEILLPYREYIPFAVTTWATTIEQVPSPQD